MRRQFIRTWYIQRYCGRHRFAVAQNIAFLKVFGGEEQRLPLDVCRRVFEELQKIQRAGAVRTASLGAIVSGTRLGSQLDEAQEHPTFSSFASASACYASPARIYISETQLQPTPEPEPELASTPAMLADKLSVSMAAPIRISTAQQDVTWRKGLVSVFADNDSAHLGEPYTYLARTVINAGRTKISYETWLDRPRGQSGKPTTSILARRGDSLVFDLSSASLRGGNNTGTATFDSADFAHSNFVSTLVASGAAVVSKTTWAGDAFTVVSTVPRNKKVARMRIEGHAVDESEFDQVRAELEEKQCARDVAARRIQTAYRIQLSNREVEPLRFVEQLQLFSETMNFSMCDPLGSGPSMPVKS